MVQFHSSASPVFPVEKDTHIPLNETPLVQTSTIQVFIQLAEPVTFIQGFDSQQNTDIPPSLLRGSLVIRVLKPSKLKSISLTLKGYSRTDWPEGIPPKKQEFVEINDIVNHIWPFYQASTLPGNVQLNQKSPRTSSSSSSLNSLSVDKEDPLLLESGASVFRNLPAVEINDRVASMSSNHLSPNRPTKENGKIDIVRKPSTSSIQRNARSLSPMGLLRRATSPSNDSPKPVKTSTPTSIFSDLLSSTFSNSSDYSAHIPNKKNLSSGITNTSNSNIHDTFVFQPGDYIYSFEQAMPSSYPETIKADFGFVEYNLFVSIERYGTFKSNIVAKLPVILVRTQSDTSIEETEPIVISRDWESQLHYDIVIASKDIILDAFLPITFRVSPIDKVTLHRIRIYLTETVEYYCKGKKVHRLEPTKKYLLAEHNGPKLDNIPSEANSSKAKYLGNLLVDETNGDLVNKDFEYQVFVPSMFINKQAIHPDTGFEKIKSNHWIKLCLRLSKIADGKRKHYEIVIDSPIHVLHKLCSHANTLLPCYDTHINHKPTINQMINHSHEHNYDAPTYHNSNIFFPKEVLLSPILSPDVHSVGFKVHHSRSGRRLDNNNSEHIDGNSKVLFNSPKLKSNIYQPDSLQRELASPQAIPLSPISSPSMQPLGVLDNELPPHFDIDTITMKSNDSTKLPNNPPSYSDVLKIDSLSSSPNNNRGVAEIKSGSKSQEKLSNLKHELANSRSESLSSLEFEGRSRILNDDEDKGDIASTFSFQNSQKSNSNLPNAIFRSQPTALNSVHMNNDSRLGRPGNLQDLLPSTIRYDNPSFNDLTDVLVSHHGEPLGTIPSNNSLINRSAFPDLHNLDGSSSQPPLQPSVSDLDRTLDKSFFNSTDLGNDLILPSNEASIDITAFYHRNSTSWHPLQEEEMDSLSKMLSNDYSFKVANSNHVLNDFKHALHDSPLQGSRMASIDSATTLQPMPGSNVDSIME